MILNNNNNKSWTNSMLLCKFRYLGPNKISETHCSWEVKLNWVWGSVTWELGENCIWKVSFQRQTSLQKRSVFREELEPTCMRLLSVRPGPGGEYIPARNKTVSLSSASPASLLPGHVSLISLLLSGSDVGLTLKFLSRRQALLGL